MHPRHFAVGFVSDSSCCTLSFCNGGGSVRGVYNEVSNESMGGARLYNLAPIFDSGAMCFDRTELIVVYGGRCISSVGRRYFYSGTPLGGCRGGSCRGVVFKGVRGILVGR